ncbi:MAG: Flagellar basal body-associated protein FliL [Ilumatobacteraceae bacterium]|nr:Flagellar basal body-associated protein FliL [Ilumatobacteraceae bacterium]
MSDQNPEQGVPAMGLPVDGLAPPPASAAPRRRSTKTVLTAVAGVLAVAAAGFALVSLTEGDGASSADDAVQELFEAVDRQDAIGVAESLEPTERRVLIDALEQTEAEARRVKVTDDELDLRSVDGVDLAVEHLTFHSTPLDDDTYAVDIDSGRISSRAQLSKMPIGPVVQEVIDRSEEAGEDVTDSADDEIDLSGTRLVAVKRGGGWYVSALYSLAEQLRLDGDPPAAYPGPGAEIPAVGADSPEAAVREGVAAAIDADVRRLIELTPADEARVLHTYGSILVDEAAGEETGVAVDDLELKVADAPGGRKKVSATSMTMTVTTDYDRAVTTYDGKCSTTTWEVTDPDEYGYGGDDGIDEWKQCDDDLSSLTPFGFFGVFYAPGGLDVIVEEHDGKWFLSPTGTVVQNTVGTLAGLDVDAVRRIARSWSGEWWIYQSPELWKACGVAEPSLDDTRTEAEAAYEQCMESLPDDYAGPWGPMGVGPVDDDDDGFDVVDVPGAECYGTGNEMPDMDDVEACLADLAAAGEIDPSQLAEFRCGRIFEEVDASSEDLSEEEFDKLWDEADEKYEACMEESETGGSDPGGTVTFGPSGSTPNGTTATTAPSATVTRPPSTTTTTRSPVATTTTTP